MSENKRSENRDRSHRIVKIVVYRDRRDLSYAQACLKLKEFSDLYSIFNVVALLRDVSPKGLGIQFEGQQLMSQNLLQPGEHYLLKIVFWTSDVPKPLLAFLRPEGDDFFLLVKAAYRWLRTSETISLAGFELAEITPPQIVDFVLDRLGHM
jgi:hypothetical protein